jgi:murein DD-endopeptidase MepM/ murein hydrolase activator NlpD
MQLTSIALALCLAGTSLMAAPAGDAAVHRVKQNETAARIARAHGLSLAALAAANPGKDLDHLSVGVRLNLPPLAASLRKKAAPGPRPSSLAQADLDSLPRTPALALAPETHLERVLPAKVSLSPGATEASSPQALASYIQPVLSRAEAAEPIPAAPSPLGFEPADPDHLDLLWPVETRTISSAWGPRMRNRVKVVKATNAKGNKRIRVPYRGSHQGVDLNAPQGTTVFAATDGRVTLAGRQKKLGFFIVVDHGNGVETVYGHNRRNFVREGDLVHRGQKIAEVGRTGNASGPHVHFELRVAGVRRNPEPFLNDVEEIPAEILAQNQAAVPPPAKR